MIAPQVPAGGAGGHASFDHQTHRQLDHPMGGVTTRGRHIAALDGAVLPALRAGVRRGGHQQGNRTSGGHITKVVEGALPGGVARGKRITSWAGSVVVVTAVRHQLRPWEVLDVDKALRWVWHVCTRSEPRVLP